MPIHFSNYQFLTQERQQLIEGWFERARAQADCEQFQCFEAFMFLWIGFNAWGGCVTEEDQDWKIIKALAGCPRMVNWLEDAKANKPQCEIAQKVDEFSQLWPILSVKDVRRKNNLPDLRNYRDKSGRPRDLSLPPRVKHKPEGWNHDSIANWSNLLWATYQVRCNLFHGAKALSSEHDQRIVSAAFQAFLCVVEESGFLNWSDDG